MLEGQRYQIKRPKAVRRRRSKQHAAGKKAETIVSVGAQSQPPHTGGLRGSLSISHNNNSHSYSNGNIEKRLHKGGHLR